MKRATFSRWVHTAIGFAVTGATLLSQQHCSTELGRLAARCILIATIFGLGWEFIVQNIVAELKPRWKWSRYADLYAGLAFGFGAIVAAVLFLGSRP